MTQLFLFNTELPTIVSDDPEINMVFEGLHAAFTAIQDDSTGFPVSGSSIQVDSVYRNTHPLKLMTDTPVKVGDLLNVYFADSPRARLATALEAEMFANSVALTPTDADGYAMCAVKVAAVPAPPLSTYAGSVYLSTMHGKYTDAPYASGQILQKVGEIIGDFFYFNFHSPALFVPSQFQNLSRSM